ncbi:unnamed protein product [Cladocopium goreaui]|uniref:C2H2-type domain-containing protein n=1 Tax=Cladocopium goreaui TaxID=2562237 RepID=A0A9P1C433_9DINO|nr:unnamed protein product [Cladocopium goreaui]
MNIGYSSQDNEDIVMMLQQPHVRPTGEQVAHTHRPWGQQTRPLQCKLPEGGVASDRIYTTDQQPDQQPPEHPEGFIELRLGDVNQCLTELRGIWEHQTIEAEGHLQVMTWYADTERWPRCPEARAVQLPSDLSQWMTRLIEAWDDRADPDEVFHLHMIQPQPQTTFWEDHPAPHVLVIQQPMPDRRSLHFTASNTERSTSQPLQFVDTLAHPATQSSVLQAAGWDDQLGLLHHIQYEIWWGNDIIMQEGFAHLRNGNALTVIARHLDDNSPHSSIASADATENHVSLLQIQAVRQPVQLTLENLLPIEEEEIDYQTAETATVAIRLIKGAEIAKVMTEVDLMSFLYDCGYWRAPIQSVESLAPGLFRVQFLNVQVQQVQHTICSRAKPAWPVCTHLIGARGPYFTPTTDVAGDDCVIGLGIALYDFMKLFTSADDILCRDPAGHDFPEVTKAALKMSASTCLDDYDRIIVYTDGSSKAKDRHGPPIWNDEQGHGDSWAFVVVGETLTDEEHKVEVLGWTTQPVIYDHQSDHFIGADGIGSYLAEREALAWAAMWRLAQNSRVADGLPPLCANGLHAPTPQLPPLSKPKRCTVQANSSHRAGNFHLSAGTANVTSLYNGPWGHAGKTDYLRQQFISHNLNFLGLQETPAPETFGQVDGVLRLGSGSAKGHYGTELWANLKIPYVWIGRQAHYLKPKDFQVLHRDPRMLAVQIETPYMKLKILVGHAPHCGHSLQEREQWWHTFSNHARLRHGYERLLVLMDANADPGPRDDYVVFKDGFLSNENTPLLQDFLTEHDLCLPDIESHVDEFNHHLLHGVANHCPQPQRAPKKPIFTAELWQLRETKLATKKALKDISKRQKQEMLLFCFSALRSRTAISVDGGFFWQYDTWLLCSRVRAYCKFHCSANQLRGRLQHAKYGQLKDILSGMTATTPAANILHEVKNLIGPTNLKKVKATTLPYVRNHQGQVCQSPTEALDTWISFFQTMEGVHQARAYLRSRKQQGLNVGMVFLDLCEAFYRIVREMAMGGITSDETIARMRQRLKLGQDTMRELYQHLDKASAIERDCWADFIFSFLWARLLHELADELKPLDILDSIPQHGGLRCEGIAADPEDTEMTGRDDYLGPTWMDDSCFCFAATDPLTLERKAANLCGLLIQRSQSYAMTPNLQPGKTAALLVFQGHGAAAARKRFFGPQTDSSLPVLLEGGVQRVQVVASYVHLGSLLHHRGDMRQEARRRFSIAQGAFQHHRKVLYQNKQLPLQRRAELFRTLILSKFVYGCDSWTLMEKHTRHYVHTSLMKLYRRLLPQAYIKLYSDEEVLQLTGLSDPSDLFRQQRLRHLGALYSCSDSVPWGLLNADTEWTQLVRSDLEWMWYQLRSSSKLPDPHHHFGAWVSLMKDHRRYWKKLVRRAGDHAAAQRDNLFSVTQFHRAILQQLHQAQCLVQGPPSEVRTLAGPAYGCMQCQRKFASRGGCGAHMFRAHGHIHPVRRLFDTTQCGCCLREFHSYGRLKAHLIRADYCRHSLQRRNHYVVPAAGIGSSENDHQERILDGLLPPLPGHGPHLPQGRHGVALDYNLIIFEEIYMRMLEVTSVAEGEAVLRAVASEIPTTWEDFRQTLQALVREATPEDTAVLGISAEDFFGILRRFSLEAQWSFLCEETEIVTEHWHRELHVLEDFCTTEAQTTHSRQGHAGVPRGFGAVRYVLHAFSGRRAIHARWVVAIIGGPPCETWSQARERSIADHAFAPRVLRVPETPWGHPSLRLKELRQIRVGNDLMGFILEAVVMLYCVGGVAALEHPAAPTSEESVSIWRTPILALLLSLPGIELVSLAQGLWGANPPSSTSFLLVNAPDMRQALRKWQITRELPKGISIGRDQAGGWSTSVLKEYPPSLNGGLAEGILAAIGQCASDPSVTVPISFADRCASMMCAEYGEHIGPDYAG